MADLAAHLARRRDIGRRHSRRPWVPDSEDELELALFLRQASAAVDDELTCFLLTHAPSLSRTDLEVLLRVRRRPSAAVELAEYLRLSRQRTSRVLQDLERRGLVLREQSWRDARLLPARLTHAGFDVLEDLDAGLGQLSRTWLGHLDDPDARRALVLLVAVLADSA